MKTIIFVKGAQDPVEQAAIQNFIGGETLVLYRADLPTAMEIHQVGVTKHSADLPVVQQMSDIPKIEFPPLPTGNVTVNAGYKKPSVGTKISVANG